MTEKNPVTLDSIVVVSSEQVSCELSGEIAILNLKEGAYYGLNTTGARIWSLIQEPKSVREVRDELLRVYEVDEERCTQDLLQLLNEMASRGLIEVRALRP